MSIATDDGVVVFPLGEDGRPEVHGYSLSRASFAPASAPGRVRLVEAGAVLQSAAVVPAMPSETLFADGAPYRGYLEVRAGEGTLSVVNVVNIEDYLRGVVPNELSPAAGPQLEAMKAQAVAARTYALRQRGDYAAKGYDLCATPACQVYRGRATEHPRADRAVAATRGLIVQYDGIPIKALYTSACGGHTEDVEEVFVGERERPYLRGVVCSSEQSAGGRDHSLSRDAALLQALDVLEPHMAAAALQGLASDAELEGWTERLVVRTGRPGCASGASEDLRRRGAFFAHVVDRLCWQEVAKESSDATDAKERSAVAFLVEEEILSIDPDHGLRPSAFITRAEAVELLARSAERAWLPELVVGDFRGVVAGRLTVARVDLEAEASYPLDDAVRVYGDLGDERPAAAGLGLSVGDPVRLVLRQGRVVHLERQRPRPYDDGDEAPSRSWQVSLSPGEVARSVSRYGTLRDVRDVQLRRVGASGRVLEVAVIGERQREELVLKGLEVRRGLGLRENLFVMERDTDARGSVRRFVFTGKGWGHGVGLCQAGAVGMARAGAGFEQILTHYYTGVTLRKAY